MFRTKESPRVCPYFQIHPINPQQRLIREAVRIINEGGLIIYPTDSCYALGCSLGNKAAMERMRRLRQLGSKHHFTLVCRDLSEISTYARTENAAYRLIKACTPGPYTFLLKATSEVPRRLQTPGKKTIGLRIPANVIAQSLLDELGQPLMSSSLIMPGETLPMTDPIEMEQRLAGRVELVIDGGYCGIETTTVIDLVGGTPEILREGKGDVKWLIS